MKKSRSKFLKIVDEKHDINFHWPNAHTKVSPNSPINPYQLGLVSEIFAKIHNLPLNRL